VTGLFPVLLALSAVALGGVALNGARRLLRTKD
jgi:hypothetical protein